MAAVVEYRDREGNAVRVPKMVDGECQTVYTERSFSLRELGDVETRITVFPHVDGRSAEVITTRAKKDGFILREEKDTLPFGKSVCKKVGGVLNNSGVREVEIIGM